MPRSNCNNPTITPYEYWDLRLRHFKILQQSPEVTEALYTSIKQDLIVDLNELLKGQEENGFKTTTE